MGKAENDKCKRAIAEIRKTIPHRINTLENQLNEEEDFKGNCGCSKRYTSAAKDFVFDAIEHAISYANNTNDLEMFRDNLQDAIHILDAAIGVCDTSVEKDDELHKQLERLLYH